MKKIIICIAFIIIAIQIPNVYAGSCTAHLDGPNIKSGTRYKTTKYNLASSYASAMGSGTRVYFYNLYRLSNDYVAWNNRKIYFYLMDEDPIFNPDDQIKTYKGTFTGLVFTDVWLETTHITGEIDDIGDHISELYLNIDLDRHNNDPNTASRSFFDYQLCQE